MAVSPLPLSRLESDTLREEDIYAQCFAELKAHAQNTQYSQNEAWENIVPFHDVATLSSLDPELFLLALRNYALECTRYYPTAFEMFLPLQKSVGRPSLQYAVTQSFGGRIMPYGHGKTLTQNVQNPQNRYFENIEYFAQKFFIRKTEVRHAN